VYVVYTPFPNLKKTADMEAGAVGYHNDKAVKRGKRGGGGGGESLYLLVTHTHTHALAL
jgi:hypothetical protein